MVYQLNIQTIPLTRRSHLIVSFPVADTAAWIWYITGATRRPRRRQNACPGSISSTVKNRLHLGLTSSTQDREQKIERLLALRARRGRHQTDRRSVLAGAGQPRGNEFRVIRPKET